ncbi:HD family phosphohydrolase [Clostridia bacterium]|nr:HD family phosphohydrolase [Clostridia bacterium]
MSKTALIAEAMIRYMAGDARRINHFMKVYAFAGMIAGLEGLGAREREILDAAALTHDIGIYPSFEKYGDANGVHQQEEGPPAAREMLKRLGCDPELTERVCWLIAHHHTYTDIDARDYQILVEADFIVNIFEDGMPEESILSVRDKIFRTKSGREFMESLFLAQSR